MATTARLMPVVSAVQAGAGCFGMQRTAAYQAIAAGTFPVKCIRAGGRWVVATSALSQLLDLSADQLAEILDADGATTATSRSARCGDRGESGRSDVPRPRDDDSPADDMGALDAMRGRGGTGLRVVKFESHSNPTAPLGSR